MSTANGCSTLPVAKDISRDCCVDAGAVEVVGIDISERMIELAREQEARQPLGIEYRVEDARAVAEHADFDLVVGAWLLVYAQTRAELVQMCTGARRAG